MQISYSSGASQKLAKKVSRFNVAVNMAAFMDLMSKKKTKCARTEI